MTQLDKTEPREYNKFGVNDLDEPSYVKVGGKNKPREYYTRWRGMIGRVFSTSYIRKHPSYLYVTICNEWKYLSNFKKWFDDNYVEGWVLDKDILSGKHKTYSPETCAFIPKELNQLFKTFKQSKSGLPNGVTKNKSGSYSARLRTGIKSNSISLGVYKTIEEANAVAAEARNNKVMEIMKTNKARLDSRILNKLGVR